MFIGCCSFILALEKLVVDRLLEPKCTSLVGTAGSFSFAFIYREEEDNMI